MKLAPKARRERLDARLERCEGTKVFTGEDGLSDPSTDTQPTRRFDHNWEVHRIHFFRRIAGGLGDSYNRGDSGGLLPIVQYCSGATKKLQQKNYNRVW